MDKLRKRAIEIYNNSQTGNKEFSKLELEKLIEELQVHQIELEIQNDELRSKQLELEEAKTQYFSLFNHAPVGYLVIDEKGIIHDINVEACEIFGRRKDYLMMHPFVSLINGSSMTVFYEHLDLVKKNLLKTNFELSLNISGKKYWIEVTITKSYQNYYLVIIKDISIRKLAEEELIESQEKYSLQSIKLNQINDENIIINLDLKNHIEELNTLKDKLHEQNDELRKNNEDLKLYHEMIEKSADPIFMIDDDDNCKMIYVNEAARKHFGASLEEIYTWRIPDWDPNFSYDKLHEHVEEIKQTKNLSIETLHKVKDGRIVPVEISLNIFYYNNRLCHFGYFKDISERKKVEKQLKKLSTAIEQSPTSIVITDTKANIEYINPKFTELTGFSPEEVIGKNPRILNSGKTDTKVYKSLWETIGKGENWMGEFINRKKNGEEFIESAIIAPLLDNERNIVHFIAVKEDVTEKRKTEQIIKQQIEQLSELNSTKDKFFSIIAHDLRNPFNSLLGYSEILAKKAPQYPIEKIQKISTSINDVARNTFKLLENLLDWSRLQTGRITANFQKIKPSDIISDIMFLCEPIAKSKNIKLSTNISCDDYIKADNDMLNTLIRNLVTNAIKFTNRLGSITIKTESGQEEIVFSISDTGIGIEPQHINTLFKIDSKLSKKGTDNENGTGLGLILCKEFIEKHNGRIRVESELGVGSTFFFTIPFWKD